MPAVINTDEECVEYMSTNGVDVTDTAKVTYANAVATSRIMHAALNVYTAASFELLTSANAPADLKQLHLWLFAADFTSGDAQRPTSIDDRWDDAQKELGLLASGYKHYEALTGAVLVLIAAGASGSVGHSRRNAPVFERETNPIFDWIDPELYR